MTDEDILSIPVKPHKAKGLVGIIDENNQGRSITIWSYGGTWHAGRTLLSNYDTAEKVNSLIDGGDIDLLGKTIEETHYIPDELSDVLPKCFVNHDRWHLQYFDANGFGVFCYVFINGEWLTKNKTKLNSHWLVLNGVVIAGKEYE